MSLELLSNELLLYLFEFLDDVHLFRAFYGLNHRFDSLFFTRGRNYYLDFRSAFRHDFETICGKYTSFITDRIISIYFSNDYDTPQQIEYFLARSIPLHLFSNLRSISFGHLHSYKIMLEITAECRYLSALTHLSFTRCSMEDNTKDYRSLVDSIWCLPKLSHCHFGIYPPSPKIYFPAPSITSLSLKHLSIPYIDISSGELSQLIEYTPCIQHLCISINKCSIVRDMSPVIPSIVSLELCNRDASFAFSKLLRCMPNLRHLTVKSLDTYLGNLDNVLAGRLDKNTHFPDFVRNIPSIYMNGRKWEEIFVNHLPRLKTFRLKMEIQYWSRQNKEDDIDKLLSSFGSHFWTREHRWFVRCDWNSKPESSYICLYTLPYSFDRFDTHTASIRSKSTSPNENDYWLYDRVHSLHYHFSLSSSSALSRIRFSHLRHLSIELPFNDNVWSGLLTFVHLNSLDVFILNDGVEAHNQLQMLLDRAPNLYSLRFSCGELSAPEFMLLKINSASLCRLDLQRYTEHKDWHWFTMKQCTELCNSSLGVQCEALRISVENPMDALELAYSMPHLRALNVQILNDEYNVPDYKSSLAEDEVIQLLKHSLDSNCLVARNDCDSRYIQLWIR